MGRNFRKRLAYILLSTMLVSQTQVIFATSTQLVTQEEHQENYVQINTEGTMAIYVDMGTLEELKLGDTTTSPSLFIENTRVRQLKGKVQSKEPIQQVEYKIYQRNLILAQGVLTTGNEFTIPNVSLLDGNNTLEICATDIFGTKSVGTTTIYTTSTDALQELNLDNSDKDGDEIPAYKELTYGTDPNKSDTDGDGLSDYIEIFLLKYNPLDKNSDMDLIEDGDEDLDEDGLSNLLELQLGSSLDAVDSDFDDLTDKEEYELHTDPTNSDTDDDGISDYDEIYNTYTNPLSKDTDGNGINDNDEPGQLIINSEEDDFTLTVNAPNSSLSGNYAVDIPEDDPLIHSGMAGWLGSAKEVNLRDGDIESAELTFKYTSEQDGIQPTVLKYNETTGIFDEVPNQTLNTDDKTVKVTINESGKYVLIDIIAFQKFFEDNQYKPTGKPVRNKVDYIIAIDTNINTLSYYGRPELMDSLNDILTNLSDSSSMNRASIVTFDSSSSRIHTDLTSPVSDSIKKLKRIYATVDGNSVYDMALQQIKMIYDSVPYNAMITTSSAIEITTSSSITFDSVQKMYKPETYTAILLVSDGLGQEIRNQGLLDYFKFLNVPIHTVTVGDNTNSSYLTKISEYTGGTNYNSNNYTDFVDQMNSKVKEVNSAVNQSEKDSDNDGLPDALELNLLLSNGTIISTDPFNPDTDGDGLLDGEEVVDVELPNYGNSPRATKPSAKAQPKSIVYHKDTDGDGIIDSLEEPGRTKKWDVSDRHLAIACGISYVYLEKAMAICELPMHILNEIYKKFGNTVSGHEYLNWKINTIKDDKSGFYAVLFEVGDNYIIAYRGTDITQPLDILTDIGLGLGIYTEQNSRAFDFLYEVISKNTKCNNIYITGHSLGGNLCYTAFAESIMSNTLDTSMIKEVVTFNGAGIRDSIDTSVGETEMMSVLDTNRDRMKSYSMEGDFLTDMTFTKELLRRYDKSGKQQRVIKRKRYSETKGGLLGDFTSYHNLKYYLEKGNFYNDIWYYE